MKLKFDIRKIIYIVYMIFVLNVFYSFFRTTMYLYMTYLFGTIAIGIELISIFKRKRMNNVLWFGLTAFVIPFLVVNIIACLTATIVWHTSYGADITQSLLRVIQIIAAFFIAYISIIWFSKESVKLLLIAGIISYLTVILRYLQGIPGISLESHGFIECCGLLFLYYLLSSQYNVKQKIKYLIVIGGILLLGGKRVVWVALLMTLIIYFFLQKFQSKQMRILKIILASYALVTFLYLWLIKSGMLSTIFSYFNIADNSRLKFWNFFSNAYELTPFYWGRGLQYTDNRMILPSTRAALWISGNVGIHNDILRTYIGWGCIPFVLYFLNFFVFNLRKLKIIGKQKNGWKYFALTSYCFFNYMVDYMITDIAFNICFFMVCILLVYEDDKIEKIKRYKIKIL